jgi:dTMP kinase
MSSKGKFVVIEGTDGSGKRTQFELLRDRIIKETGLKVFEVDFPQYEKTFFGKQVGRYLAGEFGGLNDNVPHLISVLYAADRWQAKGEIEAALQRGELILANRYAKSNMGHQTPKLPPEKQQEFIDFLLEMEYEVFGIPQEDLNIFLFVPADTAQKLVDKKAARSYTHGKKRDIHEADLDYLRKTVEMYQRLAEMFPERVVMIDCTDENGELLQPAQIHDKVWEIVEERI